ncbi:hypothetical protein ACJX0J_023973, partial [Zea mays]
HRKNIFFFMQNFMIVGKIVLRTYLFLNHNVIISCHMLVVHRPVFMLKHGVVKQVWPKVCFFKNILICMYDRS